MAIDKSGVGNIGLCVPKTFKVYSFSSMRCEMVPEYVQTYLNRDNLLGLAYFFAFSVILLYFFFKWGVQTEKIGDATSK